MKTPITNHSNTPGDVQEHVNQGQFHEAIPLGVATGAAGVLSWENTSDRTVLVTDLVLDITTEATGAATADAGQAATEVTSDTLIDGVDIGTAAGVFSNKQDAGTNGQAAGVKVAPGEFVTITASADPAGLVGTAHLFYVFL